jgi:hypothetical protein
MFVSYFVNFAVVRWRRVHHASPAVAAASCTYCVGCRLCQPSASITSPTISAPAVVRWRRVHHAAPAVAVMLWFGYNLFRLVPGSCTCGYDVYNKYMSCLGDLLLFMKSTLVVKKYNLARWWIDVVSVHHWIWTFSTMLRSMHCRYSFCSNLICCGCGDAMIQLLVLPPTNITCP